MSETEVQPKNDQNIWSIFFTLVYAAAFVWGLLLLKNVNGELPTSIPLFDLILIILAAFRLTRLFVYDHIARFVRDLFLDKEEYIGARGAVMVKRMDPISGPRRTINELLQCPWCFGMWAGLVVPFFYFLTPYAWFVILALAIAGVATFIQLLANMIGWNAEFTKRKVEDRYEED